MYMYIQPLMNTTVVCQLVSYYFVTMLHHSSEEPTFESAFTTQKSGSYLTQVLYEPAVLFLGWGNSTVPLPVFHLHINLINLFVIATAMMLISCHSISKSDHAYSELACIFYLLKAQKFLQALNLTFLARAGNFSKLQYRTKVFGSPLKVWS